MADLLNRQEFEDICKHCGVCCGSMDGDPCIYLTKNDNERYYCKIYFSRSGVRTTIGGNEFRCISIEKAIKYPHVRKVCAYADVLKEERK